MSKIIKAQIRTLEALSSAMVVINKGIDKVQHVLNTGIDKAQAVVVNALNSRIEHLAGELLLKAVEAGQRPHLQAADYYYELERLNHEYELRKAEVERLRNHVLGDESLAEAKKKSEAYLAERQAILSRKK